jgi:hypothetical protein
MKCWYSFPIGVKGKGKGKVSLCLTRHHAMKAYWGVEVYLHSFFDPGTRWRWVVSFTPRPLYPQGKTSWYPLDRRLGGPQSRSGRGGEESLLVLCSFSCWESNKCFMWADQLFKWKLLVKCSYGYLSHRFIPLFWLFHDKAFIRRMPKTYISAVLLHLFV